MGVVVANTGVNHHWLAASRMGQAGYSWCTSTLPYSSLGVHDAYPGRSTDPQWYLLSFRIGADMTNPQTHVANELVSNSHKALCKL